MKRINEKQLEEMGLIEVREYQGLDAQGNPIDDQIRMTDVLLGNKLTSCPEVKWQEDGKMLVICEKSEAALPSAQRPIKERKVKWINANFEWARVNNPMLCLIRYEKNGEVVCYRILIINGQHTVHAYSADTPNLPSNIDGDKIYGRLVELVEGEIATTFISTSQGTTPVSKDDFIFCALTYSSDEAFLNSKVLTDEQKILCKIGRELNAHLKEAYDIECLQSCDSEYYSDTYNFYALDNWVQVFTELWNYNKARMIMGDEMGLAPTFDNVCAVTMDQMEKVIRVLFNGFGKESFMWKSGALKGSKTGFANIVRAMIYFFKQETPIWTSGTKKFNRWNCDLDRLAKAIKNGEVWSSDYNIALPCNDLKQFKALKTNLNKLNSINDLTSDAGWVYADYYALELLVRTGHSPSLAGSFKIPKREKLEEEIKKHKENAKVIKSKVLKKPKKKKPLKSK